MSNIIDKLGLSVRATNVLKEMSDVNNPDDIMSLTKDRVMAEPNAGEKTWAEICELQKHLTKRLAEAEKKSQLFYERDEIAMHVLPTLIEICKNDQPMEGETGAQMVARTAYNIADAMLAARKTTKAKG